ncbi:DUF397 domain-containing protein [Streptomyces sp. NPDC096191]|uniref:DUF397 domain-containing protein n=1 Tax=Streptomyces sp. NPDC096191 TaxID=3155426 RepID=UPI0033256ACE
MSHENASDLIWVTSSYSDSSNPSDCVEVAITPATIHIRDSKRPDGPRLAVAPEVWTAFVRRPRTR